jgi:hypothetical protein
MLVQALHQHNADSPGIELGGGVECNARRVRIICSDCLDGRIGNERDAARLHVDKMEIPTISRVARSLPLKGPKPDIGTGAVRRIFTPAAPPEPAIRSDRSLQPMRPVDHRSGCRRGCRWPR